MPYAKLVLKPGIDKQNTEYGAEGGWIDADYVRFRYGLPEKVGGWVNFGNVGPIDLIGMASEVLAWSDLNGVPHMAVGTNRKLYVFVGGGWYDITPIRIIISPTSTFSTTDGSDIVTMTFASGHGAIAGDFVTLSSVSSAPGGLTDADLTGEFEVLSTPTGDSLTIKALASATSTVATTGGATATFQINIGSDTTYFDFGFGIGGFGISPYGEPAPASGTLALASRVWQLDTFGENLIAQVNGGKMYQWSPSVDGVNTRASAVTGAPTKNNFALVSTPDRHLVAFGTEGTVGDPSTFDPMFVRFSSQEDVSTWVETATNTAGGQRLTDGNKIISALRSRGQILIFTDNSLHGMQYIGPPFTFGFQQLGANCGLIGPHAAVDVNGIAFWMGQEDFFLFDGTVKKLPCTVQDYVFKDINLVQGTKVHVGRNGLFNEITWWYCTSDSVYINRYVTFNYLEQSWSIGTMPRNTWQDVGVYNLPIAAQYLPTSTETPATTTAPSGLTAGRSRVFTHEFGYDANGEPIEAYLQAGFFDIGDGDQMMFMKRFIPDFKDQRENITLHIRLRRYPQVDSEISSLDPYTITPSTDKVDTRARGRQISFIIASEDLGSWWRFGTARVDIQPDGLR